MSDYNVYQDANTGGWIVEVVLFPNDERPEIHRLGVYGTKEAALKVARDESVSRVVLK